MTKTLYYYEKNKQIVTIIRFFLLFVFINFGFITQASPVKKLICNSWIKIIVDKKDGSQLDPTYSIYKSELKFDISRFEINQYYDGIKRISRNIKFISDSLIQMGTSDFYRVLFVNDSTLIMLENDDGRPDHLVNRFTFIKEKYLCHYLFNVQTVRYVNDTVVSMDKLFLHFYTAMWKYKIEKKVNIANLDGRVNVDIIMDSLGRTVQVNVVDHFDIPDDVVEKFVRLLKDNRSWNLWLIRKRLYYKVQGAIDFNPGSEYSYTKLKLFF